MGVKFSQKELAAAQKRIAGDVHGKNNVGVGIDVHLVVPAANICEEHLKPSVFNSFLASYHIPAPQQEFRFDSERKFRFDYAWPDKKVALEVEGGVFGHSEKKTGAHSSVTGILRDMEKYNLATSTGWRILRVIPDNLLKTNTAVLIRSTLSL